MKKTGIIAFTEHGCVLGEKLLRDLQKQDQEIYGFVKSKYVDLPERHSFQKVTGTLREWAEEWIPKLDGIVFFSATGIAVRTIAPFVVSKKTDPAVVVIDEQGNYAISLLSGHLGGANELAKFAAESIGAVPVITTGTDVNHTFAVDVFARKNNLVIADMRLAKEMAALLIRGKTITWGAGEGFVYPKGQNIPLQLQFQETESPDGKKGTLWFAIPQSDGKEVQILHLYPKNVYLGAGCRKHTPEEKIETQIRTYLSEAGISITQILQAASIDLKKEEPGLLAFCEKYQIPFVTYSKEELEQMCEEIRMYRELGANGVVIGALTPDGDLDLDAMRRLMNCAGNMDVTLHRAFDMTRDPFAAMEDAIRLGRKTILTSGQQKDPLTGAELLRELFEKADDRIDIMAGCGVKKWNIQEIHDKTGIVVFHTTGRKGVLDSGMRYRKQTVAMGLPSLSEYELWQTDEEEFRACAQIVHSLAAGAGQ